MVTFTESQYNESEGAGSMRIGIQLSRTLQRMITIQVVTMGITAQGFIFKPYCYNFVINSVQEMELILIQPQEVLTY